MAPQRTSVGDAESNADLGSEATLSNLCLIAKGVKCGMAAGRYDIAQIPGGIAPGVFSVQ